MKQSQSGSGSAQSSSAGGTDTDNIAQQGLRLLERICRTEKGATAVSQCGGVGVVSQVMKVVGTDSKASQVRPFHTIHPECWPILRSLLCPCLRHPQAGLRVLNKVARSNVAELVRKLDHNTSAQTAAKPAIDPSTGAVTARGRRSIVAAASTSTAVSTSAAQTIAVSDTDAEASVTLLASLAMEPDNVDKIVSAGGVFALIRALRNPSKVWFFGL